MSNRSIIKCFLLLFAIGVGFSFINSNSVQAIERPLFQDGKTTVFQRVLTRPDAKAYDSPSGNVQGSLSPFTPLYVYSRKGDWLQVGRGVSMPEFFLPKDKTVDWKHNIVASFTHPSGRSRQLFMDSEAKLIDLMESENVEAKSNSLLEHADADELPAGSGVNAVEPHEHIDIKNQFYLMPILDFNQDLHPLTLEQNLRLNVASIPKSTAIDEPTASEFDVGIVFVLDTTQSMGPFIFQTNSMLAQIIGGLRESEFKDRVHFGAVAFRDNPEAVPGLGYRTQTIVPLERRDDHSVVIRELGKTREATVSSPGFNEDSVAGISHALHNTQWAPNGKKFGGKYLILVTDAGPKPPGDKNAESDIDTASMQIAAQEKDVAILTMHLRTPGGGSGNHKYAEDAYTVLSRFEGQTFYYPIEKGDPQLYRNQVERLVQELTGHVQESKQKELISETGESAEGLGQLGRAMYLTWLGSRDQTQAPDIISSWVSENTVFDGTKKAFSPRLLVTKNELSTLAELLEGVIEAGEEIRSADDAEDFFLQIRELVLRMAQNPDRLVNPAAEGPGDVLEFLKDLPYKSKILAMNEERWMENAQQRRKILDSLRPDLDFYQAILRDPDLWTELHEGAPDGEKVYAMPFALLP